MRARARRCAHASCRSRPPYRRSSPASSTSSPSPKLRLLKWVNPGVGLGVRWFRWWLLWLRGDGEGDGGVEEVEGAALVGGGFGEHGHVDGGAVVAELVAGEGGQVIE